MYDSSRQRYDILGVTSSWQPTHMDAEVIQLNRLITKEAIWEYEQLTSDQKKLLSQVLTCLDHRTQQLRMSVKGQRGSAAPSAPTSNNLASVSSESTAVRELTKCLDLLETIRKMGSKTRVPVVLVYRERRHRTQHRHQEKGQSNKVVFAKEKRDFLSLLGLPGSMISEKGIDFSVRPNTASALRRQSEEKKSNSSASTASASASAAAAAGNTTDTIEVRELEPDEKNGGGTIQTDGGMEREPENDEEDDEEEDEEVNIDEEDDDDDDDDDASPKTAKKVLLQLLPFSKRKGSVSPHPKSDLSEEEDDIPADARSTLSCDTCSSAESSETEEEVDVATDLAVLGATYAHKESVKPPPFRDADSTYVSLDLEKIGIKNTRGVVCPFARVSLRDAQGAIVGPGSTQETLEWEVVNKNYLRAPSEVHLQRPLEEISDDVAIFVELRHYKPQKGVISTLCYTFLEKNDLKTGDFICELYSPPVDFSRRSLKAYTEKAFFLHFRVRLLKAEQDDLDSQQSNLS
ncbi:uncharacterized protein LOC122251746 [Penaeus japonicus]|uniref:uncharacterized protein LOC122251746 n=1 Tax=Penaeus japonicus TaxID=27405 RepID=UPI001C715B10|nr:uncharacterized protein LOC122251746 [Penaeus japonicus]